MAQPQRVDGYTLQFARSIDALPDTEWDKLPRSVQNWSNSVARAANAAREAPTVAELQEALMDATSYLANATWCYRELVGPNGDDLHTGRIADFDKAVERARAVAVRIPKRKGHG